MSKINMLIYNAIISELWLSGFEIKENVCGAGRVRYMIRDGQEVQGFLDNKGRFYDRKEAAEIYNQYAEKKVGKMLFSEDLY